MSHPREPNIIVCGPTLPGQSRVQISPPLPWAGACPLVSSGTLNHTGALYAQRPPVTRSFQTLALFQVPGSPEPWGWHIVSRHPFSLPRTASPLGPSELRWVQNPQHVPAMEDEAHVRKLFLRRQLELGDRQSSFGLTAE